MEKLEGKVGDQVELKEVLMVSKEGEAQFGTPHLTNVVIQGEIVQESKGEKVLTYKMKRRKRLLLIQRTLPDLYHPESQRHCIKLMDRWNSGIMG